MSRKYPPKLTSAGIQRFQKQDYYSRVGRGSSSRPCAQRSWPGNCGIRGMPTPKRDARGNVQYRYCVAVGPNGLVTAGDRAPPKFKPVACWDNPFSAATDNDPVPEHQGFTLPRKGGVKEAPRRIVCRGVEIGDDVLSPTYKRRDGLKILKVTDCENKTTRLRGPDENMLYTEEPAPDDELDGLDPHLVKAVLDVAVPVIGLFGLYLLAKK